MTDKKDREDLRRALMIEGMDLWRRLGITRAQASDIADRLIRQGRFSIDRFTGELMGDDFSLAVADMQADKDARHLFTPADAPEEKPRSTLPESVQKMSAEERLRYANEQAFANMRRKGVDI